MNLGSGARGHRHREEADDVRERGHQHRPEPRVCGILCRLGDPCPFFTALHDGRDQHHAVHDSDAEEGDEPNARGDGEGVAP